MAGVKNNIWLDDMECRSAYLSTTDIPLSQWRPLGYMNIMLESTDTFSMWPVLWVNSVGVYGEYYHSRGE